MIASILGSATKDRFLLFEKCLCVLPQSIIGSVLLRNYLAHIKLYTVFIRLTSIVGFWGRFFHG